MEEKIATMLVFGSFYLPSRNFFVVYGEPQIEPDKELVPGVMLYIDLNSTTSISKEVHSIEYVLKQNHEYIALCLKIEDPNELAIFKGLNIGEEFCDIFAA